jgi:hypothetical protein
MSKVKIATSGERIVIELTPVQAVNLHQALVKAEYQFESNKLLAEKLDDILEHFDLDNLDQVR